MTAAHVTLCLAFLVLIHAAPHVAAKTNDTTSTTATTSGPMTPTSSPTTTTSASTTTTSDSTTTTSAPTSETTREDQPTVCGRINSKHDTLCHKMCFSDGWKHGKCLKGKCTCSEQKL
uniref:Invertebrate defensins family profile domain-containing protein n=1 Tax=Cuerna arida TaxID=1464854 RepID=A0A1B6GWU9_9HEMI